MNKLWFRKFLTVFLVLSLFVFYIPLTQADYVAKEDYVFRTFSNNASFVMGADFTFYKTEVNSTHLWLDKSYTDGYYTRYCIYVNSPNDTKFTVNSWFATKDSSASLTIETPLATNINLSFYSPNLLTASATGVTSSSWSASSKTLNMIVNSDTSLTFTIRVTVSETEESNITPENNDVTITDYENIGGEKWVFSETEYYTFRSKFWDGNGYATLDTMKIKFTDEVNTIIAVYDQPETAITLDSGDDAVNLKGTVTVLDSNMIQIDFGIYFKNTILDAYDIEIYMWCNDTSGSSDGWDEIQTNYFTIYNLGGHSELTSSGDAGRVEGGDVFEIYATSESWCEVETTYRNLQHIKILVYLSVWGDQDEAMGLKYSFAYCTEEDEWIDPGFEIEIKPIEGVKDGGDVYFKSNVYFTLNGEAIKNETIYSYIKVQSITLPPPIGTLYGTASTWFWIDLWFNKINASSTIAGRVNAYEYPMKNSADAWLQWLKTDWGANEDLRKQSMAVATMTHDDGSTLYTNEIKLVKVKCRIYMDNQTYPEYSFFSATDYDVFDLTFGNDPFTGIQTPVFDETKVPVMPQGGFLGSLFSWFGLLINGLGELFGPAILGFWNTFVGFMDTIFTWAGWPNGFSQILSFIGHLVTWVSQALGFFISFMISSFTFLSQSFLYILDSFAEIIGTLASIVAWLEWMWNMLYPYWGWTIEVGIKITPLLVVFYFIWLLSPLLDKGDIHGVRERLDDTIGMIVKIATFFLNLVDMLIDTVYRLIEMIPGT